MSKKPRSTGSGSHLQLFREKEPFISAQEATGGHLLWDYWMVHVLGLGIVRFPATADAGGSTQGHCPRLKSYVPPSVTQWP